MKGILVILGPGAAGKTTLTQTLAGPEYEMFNREYVIAATGFAFPGTWKNGSDAVSIMAQRAELIKALLAASDVKCVILDGVRCSKRWDVDWVQSYPRPIATVYAYFDLPDDEIVRRLLQRRKANGKEEIALPEKTLTNMRAFKRRAQGVFEEAKRCYLRQPVKFVTIGPRVTPQQAAALVRKTLKEVKVL